MEKDEDITVMNISREDVEKGRLENYLREFKKYEKKKMRGKVTLIFNGYEQDRREIYQIREITNWVDRLLKNVPYLFYFLSRENYSMRIVFFCLSEVVGRSGVEVSITKEQGRRLIEKVTKSAVVYARKLKEPEEVQLVLAEGILDELGYEQTKQ
ncbi:hypothetical protein [Paenibacillus sp. P46E]|uniref:hypothetical protein n=1 Tax=Paenibacillus sp. P46E TaxID=1349436 RepID=UPI00093C91C5|nr:hypothetical protein [Paenibacillus sp. P46E]OKP96503.1 hypothetical protein A3849_20645 [Paenibacillus sp. P46E]